MPFKLAEAFVELKAKGHDQVVRETEKVKDKTKELGPAVDEAAKRFEKAADRMAAALQKPAESAKNFSREFSEATAKMRRDLEALAEKSRGGGGVDGGGGGFGMPGGRFGSFLAGRAGLGPMARFGAGGGLFGIGHAVAQRGAELADGAQSPILPPEVNRQVADFTRGVIDATKAIKTGFIDGLLGAAALLADFYSLGFYSRLGSASAKDERDKANQTRRRTEGYAIAEEARKRIGASDEQLEDFDRQQDILALGKEGGIKGMRAYAEEQRNLGLGGDKDALRQYELAQAEILRMTKDTLATEERITRQKEAQLQAQISVIEDGHTRARVYAAAMQDDIPPALARAMDAAGLSPSQRDDAIGAHRAAQRIEDEYQRREKDKARRLAEERKAIEDAERAADKARAVHGSLNDVLNEGVAGIQEREQRDAVAKEFDRQLRGERPTHETSFQRGSFEDLQSMLQDAVFDRAERERDVEQQRRHDEIRQNWDDMLEKVDEQLKNDVDLIDAVKNQLARFA